MLRSESSTVLPGREWNFPNRTAIHVEEDISFPIKRIRHDSQTPR